MMMMTGHSYNTRFFGRYVVNSTTVPIEKEGVAFVHSVSASLLESNERESGIIFDPSFGGISSKRTDVKEAIERPQQCF